MQSFTKSSAGTKRNRRSAVKLRNLVVNSRLKAKRENDGYEQVLGSLLPLISSVPFGRFLEFSELSFLIC